MAPARVGPIVLCLCWVVIAQTVPPKVVSARVEDLATVPDKTSIHVRLRNTGERAITAYSVAFYRRDSNGDVIPCGGRGADMIDWSDPMPGRNIYVHMHRNWIEPNGLVTVDGYPRCSDQATSLDGIQVELILVMFDDGSGEGDPRRIESILRTRQQSRNERLKWVDRFTALRHAPDLRPAAQSLYQDLVDAARSAEINPEDAAREGMAKPVRDELLRLALDITQWASHSRPGQKNEFIEWRITDLEQRTVRLVRGAGNTDVRPQ